MTVRAIFCKLLGHKRAPGLFGRVKCARCSKVLKPPYDDGWKRPA